MVAKILDHNNKELKQARTTATTTGTAKKNDRFILAKQQLCTCITLFFSSDIGLPNFTRPLYELVNTAQKFSFSVSLNSDTVLSDSTPDECANM